MNNWKVWIHGLLAAAISAFASAASGAIALPTVFGFNEVGFINMAKLATVPALLAVFGYLKASPIPQLSTIVSAPGNVEVTKGTVAVTSDQGAQIIVQGEKKQ